MSLFLIHGDKRPKARHGHPKAYDKTTDNTDDEMEKGIRSGGDPPGTRRLGLFNKSGAELNPRERRKINGSLALPRVVLPGMPPLDPLSESTDKDRGK